MGGILRCSLVYIANIVVLVNYCKVLIPLVHLLNSVSLYYIVRVSESILSLYRFYDRLVDLRKT